MHIMHVTYAMHARRAMHATHAMYMSRCMQRRRWAASASPTACQTHGWRRRDSFLTVLTRIFPMVHGTYPTDVRAHVYTHVGISSLCGDRPQGHFHWQFCSSTKLRGFLYILGNRKRAVSVLFQIFPLSITTLPNELSNHTPNVCPPSLPLQAH